ncbi:MAG: NADH:flavin oxidoreductase/NADH oxidase family protein [Parvibaculum sp.]|uniref:NADH:flavin oxidoreductase/NADH oxidase family protein n=1 Tax=Parvibaculum sp. TaxID=2024848 RepID=UPI0025E478C6|nr:NADH:flavin oxidoreductase/NADH oxidase family protein [Parvibaculum sp.]MCE9650314.1 NADH:flavin oxidoreductase/NADH oxidase family protein [Parvibaculum sp.]
MTSPLATPLTLPGGAVLANRIVKAAMSEGVADAHNDVTPRLINIYRRWSESGAGLLLSGNVQVDRFHLERPGNVVFDGASDLAGLRAYAEAGTHAGNHFWAQLSHTGRQVDEQINAAPLSPSDVEIDFPRGAGYAFARPRIMTEADIENVIAQFAFASKLARDAGFTGVQLHAAHGYIISQFLSPLANRRTDAWGGSLKNRARLLIETIAAVRKAVGPGFPISIKLNSSDFQKGGFTNDECVELVGWLNETSLDLLELSGGSLEQPKVVGIAVKDEGVDARPASTKAREAYFVDYSARVRAAAKMPVMVTGGFRTVSVMEEALTRGELDAVGIGRPMLVDPELPKRILSGEVKVAPAPEASIDLFHLLPWFNAQFEHLADNLDPDPALTGEAAAALFKVSEAKVFADLLAARAGRAA